MYVALGNQANPKNELANTNCTNALSSNKVEAQGNATQRSEMRNMLTTQLEPIAQR